MKTNLVKTAIVALAISFALTSCENDTLNELETEKATIQQIKPIDNHNHRDLEIDFDKKSPLLKRDSTPSIQNKNQNERNSEVKESKNTPIQKESNNPLNHPSEKEKKMTRE